MSQITISYNGRDQGHVVQLTIPDSDAVPSQVYHEIKLLCENPDGHMRPTGTFDIPINNETANNVSRLVKALGTVNHG